MRTRFFRFPDMATSFALAQANGLTYTEDGEEWLLRYCTEWAIHVQGEIPGEPGWHVYVRTESAVPDAFLPYEWQPGRPMPGDFS